MLTEKGKKNHHCTIRVMVITSSHVFVFSSLRVGGSTQGGYMALELFFVSARTNKRHHHHYPELFSKAMSHSTHFFFLEECEQLSVLADT
jgi:hypothetical protein